MGGYVKVMGTMKDKDGNAFDTSKELIRLECLHKVVRWNGDQGTEICFEWYDEEKNADRQWVYDCVTNYARDSMFEEYEKQLCGCVKSWG